MQENSIIPKVDSDREESEVGGQMSNNKMEISDSGIQISDMDSLQRFCKMAHASGFFGTRTSGEALVKELAQAAVKVEYGLELGLPPIAALTNVYTVDGKPSLSAGAIGGLIKKSNRYTFTVSSSDQACTIEWFERAGPSQREPLGQSSFSMEDAKRAGLAQRTPWKRYPKSMLFARALTQGARMFCQDIFLGAVYTPEELSESGSEFSHENVASQELVTAKVINRPSDILEDDDD